MRYYVWMHMKDTSRYQVYMRTPGYGLAGFSDFPECVLPAWVTAINSADRVLQFEYEEMFKK